MTIQEQANAILERTDTDELLLRLVQDRAALLEALKLHRTECLVDDTPMVDCRCWACITRRAIAQAERP